MTDPILAEARVELSRVSKMLAEAQLEAERCRLRLGRLEGEKIRAQALVDMLELAQRLANKPAEAATPAFHIKEENGAKFVVVDKPAVSDNAKFVAGLDSTEPFGVKFKPPAWPALPQRKIKPDGLPLINDMIVAALEAGGHDGLPPRAIVDFIRRKWWPEMPSGHVRASLHHLVYNKRKLEMSGGLYRLNRVPADAKN
jgi:hypothetical protein